MTRRFAVGHSLGVLMALTACPAVSEVSYYIANEDDSCHPNPCLNGGTCSNDGDGYSCSCDAGFDGSNCENNANANACVPNPCLNGGTCSNDGDGYSCSCNAGSGGSNCENNANANACVPNPCLNGGTCSNDGDGYSCSCAAGFEGRSCEDHDQTLTETQIDPSNPPEMLYAETRSGEKLVLHRDSRRGPNYEVLRIEKRGTAETIPQEPVRTYLGHCLSDQESFVAATLLPNGDLRYHIFRGNSEDTWDTPLSSRDEYQSTDRNAKYYAPWNLPDSEEIEAIGSFTESDSSLASWSATTSLIIDKSYFDETGFSKTSTLLEKIDTSMNFTDAIYIRDMGLRHLVDKVIIRDWYDADNWASTKELVDTCFAAHDSQHFATIASWNGGLAYVCGAHSVSAAYFSDEAGSGEFHHVFRHEIGHNHGASHYEGGRTEDGGPEGPTVMSGNSIALSRTSGPERDTMQRCIQQNFATEYGVDDSTPPYFVPPFAKYDKVLVDSSISSISIDVLGNDFDANRDKIAIADFDSDPPFGGTVYLSSGTGPNGRDQLTYDNGSDFDWEQSEEHRFSYRIIDEHGRVGAGSVVLQMQPFELTIKTDAELRALGANPAKFSEHYRRFGLVHIVTSDGNWAPSFTLPCGDELEGKQFKATVNSTYSVAVVVDDSCSDGIGGTVDISTRGALSLEYTDGTWSRK